MQEKKKKKLQREISERDPNKVWQSIKTVIASKKDGHNLQPDVSPDDLNSFFVSVGPRIANEIHSTNTAPELYACIPRVGVVQF